jgi:HSP20 family molecular chaperone IbpA
MPEKSLAVRRAEEPSTIKPVKFESLLDRMDEVFNNITKRAFEIFEENGRIFGHELDDWLKAENEFLHPVHIRLAESGESFDVQAEVPGFDQRDLEIMV